MSEIKENQWYHSPQSKRLFMIKEIHHQGAGPTTKKTMVNLVEALNEKDIFYKYDEFLKLLESKQLEKIS